MSAHSVLLYGALSLSLAAFVVLLRAAGAVAAARRVVATARESVATLRSAALSDLEKEVRVQRASAVMLGLAASLLARAGLALAAALAVAALGVALGLYGAEEATAAAVDPAFLVVTGVVTVAALVRWR